MKSLMQKLFSDYLSEQKIASQPEYAALAKEALQKEKELRCAMGQDQARLFEELSEISAQIHFLEVKDAFAAAFRQGAEAAWDFII